MTGRLALGAVCLLIASTWATGGEPAAAEALADKPPVALPAPAAVAPASPSSDAQFFAELAYKDVATAADTARALAILVSEGKETGADFDAARAYLRQQKVLPDGWLDSADAQSQTCKGRLAVLLCKALGIKGGLRMRLFGPLPRLALNECAYLEIMVGGCDFCYVSGGELVGAIDRADRLRSRLQGQTVPKLQGEPSADLEANP